MTLVETTCGLVDVPSVTGHEGAVCEVVAARLGGAGVPLTRVGNSLVAGARSGRPVVLLVGHLDTVPPQGQGPALVEGGRIHGLGAADMKGGVAIMIHLLEEIVGEEGAAGPFDVVGVFYAGEEGPFATNEMEAVLDAVPSLDEATFALVLEPSDGEIQVGCTGVVNARVTFLGKAAHSARPWLGENAVSKAGDWLVEMHRRPAEPRLVGGLEFREVMSVTTAVGGVARNIVPSRFDLNVNYRFSPERSVDEAVAEVERACAAADEIEIVDAAPAGRVDTEHPLLDALRHHTGAALAPKQGWTDVARLTARGIPAVNYGPGETARAHQPIESVAIADLDRCYEALRSILSTGGAESSTVTS